MANKELGSKELYERAKLENPKAHFLDDICNLRTLSLFVEKNITKMEPLYTLKPFDYKGCKSFKRLYLECEDPTGYLFAEKYLYDYNHLMRLKSIKALKPFFEAWDNELELKMRAEAIREVRDIAKSKNSQSLMAAKFIANKDWEGKKAGRPKKAEVERRIKQDADLSKQLEEDYSLISN